MPKSYNVMDQKLEERILADMDRGYGAGFRAKASEDRRIARLFKDLERALSKVEVGS